MQTVTLYLRVDPRKIVLLKSILEGYEGFVVVRTTDPGAAIVQLLVSPDFVDEVEVILSDLSAHIWMEPVAEPYLPPGDPGLECPSKPIRAGRDGKDRL